MKTNTDSLKPVTIRFKQNAYYVIKKLAELNGISKTEIIRWSLDNRLNTYCKRNICQSEETELEIRKLIYEILSEISGIRSELVRIKNNYILQSKKTEKDSESFENIEKRFNDAAERSGKVISKLRG